MKRFGTVVILGSVFALMGCGEGLEPVPATESVEAEQLSTAEQQVTVGALNAACAESLTLRNSPGGTVIGTMYTNGDRGISKFSVQSVSGSWAYGYSHSLGRLGYAMTAYLTANYSESGTPGQIGYNYWCKRSDGVILGGGIN